MSPKKKVTKKKKNSPRKKSKKTPSNFGNIIFLGLADFVRNQGGPYPVGLTNIYSLGLHKTHFMYPALTQNNLWLFLVHIDYITCNLLAELKIQIVHENGVKLGDIKFLPVVGEIEKKEVNTEDHKEQLIPISMPEGSSSILLAFKIDTPVQTPGRHIIKVSTGKSYREIGSVFFHYSPVPPLTQDQILALEADALSVKTASIVLGCKHCPKKTTIYTGIKRIPKKEKEGWIWQHDVPDEFRCDCGKTHYSLRYIRESVHGLLKKSTEAALSTIEIERRYSYKYIIKKVEEFRKLINEEEYEEPIQKHIENNRILLTRFHATRIWIKPSILGLHSPDFAVLNTKKELIFIELERPSIPLFKVDKHPTAKLNHAYGQVIDWLSVYKKHPQAVLDVLGLSMSEITSVRGAIIAGRSKDVNFEAIQRHLSSDIYQNIEFMTIDILADSLEEISKSLIE